MKRAIIPTLLAVSFFLEVLWGNNWAWWNIRPPIMGTVLFYLFWKSKLLPRLWLAGLGGLLLDSISLYPFGTHLIILVALAFLTEALQSFFSNIESWLTYAVGVAINIFLFLNLTLLVGSFLQKVLGMASAFSTAFGGHVFIAAIVWAVLLPLFLTVFIEILSRLSKYTYEKV